MEQAGLQGIAYCLHLPSGDVSLEPSDYEVSSEDMPGRLVATEGRLTIALDITVIQNLRKDSGFEVTDKITAYIENLPEVAEAVQGFRDYIASQTLAREIVLQDSVAGAVEVEWLDDRKIMIRIER